MHIRSARHSVSIAYLDSGCGCPCRLKAGAVSLVLPEQVGEHAYRVPQGPLTTSPRHIQHYARSLCKNLMARAHDSGRTLSQICNLLGSSALEHAAHCQPSQGPV